MDETNTTTETGAENPNAKKAISMETMETLAPKLATKEHVQEAIAGALTAGVKFATTEEVLALFEAKSGGDGGA